jgi:aspartyl protease
MMRLTAVVVVLLILGACQSRPSATESGARPGTPEKPQVISLQRFRKALWTVRVTASGKPGTFLLDTGGGATLVTEEFAKSLGCRFWGRRTGYNMFGERGDGPHCDGVSLMAAGVALTPVDIGKIDFGNRFTGDATPDGLLSLDAFDGKVITLDQAAATLTLETPGSLEERTRSMTEVPLRLSRGCSARCLDVYVAAPTRQGTAWLTLDSGAGGVSLIAKDHALAFGLDPDTKEQRLSFELAPGIPVDSPALVTEMIMDGNLGQPFISQYLMTLDLVRGRVWFARAGISHQP